MKNRTITIRPEQLPPARTTRRRVGAVLESSNGLERLELEQTLAARKYLAHEWFVAQLLARLSVAGAELEIARNDEYLRSVGISVTFTRHLANSLRRLAVKRGADPSNPGKAHIDRAVQWLERQR